MNKEVKAEEGKTAPEVKLEEKQEVKPVEASEEKVEVKEEPVKVEEKVEAKKEEVQDPKAKEMDELLKSEEYKFLRMSISYGERLVDRNDVYTKDSLKILRTELEKAKKVFQDKDNLTMKLVQDTRDDLERAIVGLVKDVYKRQLLHYFFIREVRWSKLKNLIIKDLKGAKWTLIAYSILLCFIYLPLLNKNAPIVKDYKESVFDFFTNLNLFYFSSLFLMIAINFIIIRNTNKKSNTNKLLRSLPIMTKSIIGSVFIEPILLFLTFILVGLGINTIFSLFIGTHTKISLGILIIIFIMFYIYASTMRCV